MTVAFIYWSVDFFLLLFLLSFTIDESDSIKSEWGGFYYALKKQMAWKYLFQCDEWEKKLVIILFFHA